MRNKIYQIFKIIFFIIFLNFNAHGNDQFNFDITEIEILENGNIFKGLNKGTIKTDNGIIIHANSFEYNKLTNILTAKEDVIVEDTIKNYTIFSDHITYFKNDEIIKTKGNSKVIDHIKNQIINSDKLEYNKLKNTFQANGNAKIEDTIKNYTIFSDHITYFKNDEIIKTKGNSKVIDHIKNQIINSDKLEYNKLKNTFQANGNAKIEDTIKNYTIFSDHYLYLKDEKKIITKGSTEANIQSKYNIKSENIIFFEDKQRLTSEYKTTIKDQNLNVYQLDRFSYLINTEELKGDNIIIVSNFGQPNSEKIFFSNAIINLNKKNSIAKDTKISIAKNAFGNENNDPRLYGASSKKDNDVTIVSKGVFTSCNKNDECPPWSIQASEIIHDKKAKKLTYKNALLKIYNIPVLYFPRFFHPDPTVKRQSGLLQPRINSSNVLGSSLNIPYYHVISDNKDITFNPTFFDGDLDMWQNEYRQENIKSSFIANFGLTTNYESDQQKEKKNISHLFSKFNIDLDLDNFIDSDLNLFIEKTNKDTFLKVFNSNLIDNEVKPKDSNVLFSGLKFYLNHEDFVIDGGLSSYENLNKKNSDRYQYILPYYNFSSRIYSNDLGNVDFYSNGNNVLQNTNNLKTTIVNNIKLTSDDYIISRLGVKNNLNLYFKNVNTIAKNDPIYKESPQSELMNITEIQTSLPQIRKNNLKTELLTPKLSLRFNPTDMKNHTNSERKIDTNNIFSLERLGLNDSFESGKSLTVGVDYLNQNLVKDNEYGAKLATVYRDTNEDLIPLTSTLNKKKSYLFGAINFKQSDFLNLEYNFAANDDNEINDHSIELDLTINNFVTNFNFIEEGGTIGSQHVIENKSTYKFNKKNYLSFKTRRNKEINLTEYYDLIYEYKNDCLKAGIKFNKSYYEDRDLKPSESLFFSITLIPLTNYEQKIDQSILNRSSWRKD